MRVKNVYVCLLKTYDKYDSKSGLDVQVYYWYSCWFYIKNTHCAEMVMFLEMGVIRHYFL